MNWANWEEFFAMGGYGLYVWGSYAVTVILVVLEVALIMLRRRAICQHLQMREGRSA